MADWDTEYRWWMDDLMADIRDREVLRAVGRTDLLDGGDRLDSERWWAEREAFERMVR